MAMTITHASAGSVTLKDTQTLRGTTVTTPAVLAYSYAWAHGTGLDQADLWYVQIGKTLATATADVYDLDGALTDSIGAAMVYAKVKEVIIHITSVVVGDILVIGAGSAPIPFFDTPATDAYSLGPGGLFHVVEPSLLGLCAVTATTADKLTLTNSGANTVTYDIAIIGTTA
jgi:hypothetical protein